MAVSRREFIRGGVSAFTIGFAAPAFLSDLARAQGAIRRNLVILYLGGGNDALNTVVPYLDPFYYSRRQNIAVPAGQVLQIGTDSSGKALGLHPRLTGLRDLFNSGSLAIVQRTGYLNSSRSHFQGKDIWDTANPTLSESEGWLGRYLETVPLDPLSGWSTTQELPRALMSREVSVPSIPNAAGYAFSSFNAAEAANERAAATRIASHVPVDRPHLAFVNTSAQAAFATIDRVASAAIYTGTVAYPNNNPLALALRTVAEAIVRGIGTRVFWVQTGGYDTHANQGVAGGGAYNNLMGIFGDAVALFCEDLRRRGPWSDTLILQFSEFGRRVFENGSLGTDHGAAAVMMAAGGMVRGGLYGTAPSLDPSPANQTLENNGGDVRFETDFRSVYARVLDNWLGANSTAILGGDFRAGAPAII
jgi:uncharacterized protein (DUF1501 family)